MFQKAIDEMRGDEVHAHDGRIGALDDLYFDCDSWRVRYLVVELGDGARVLISAGSAGGAAATRDRVHVELSRAQVDRGTAAWPVETAARWLDSARVCSLRALAGSHVEALDGTAGVVADLVIDDELWSIDYMLVAAARPQRGQILVPLDWVRHVDPERRAVLLSCTREELFSSPQL